MTKLTESSIEDFTIKLFERLRYDFIPALDGENKRPELMGGEARVVV